MASRTGQAQPIPRLDRSTGVSADIGQVRYATTAPGGIGALAAPAGALSGTLRQLIDSIEDRRDLYAADEAARAGAIAGAKPELPPKMDPATIKGRAFNQAARDTVITRWELEGLQALGQHEDAHMADPVGFAAVSNKYLDGLSVGMQDYDPELASRYTANFKLQQQNILQRIDARHTAVVRDGQIESALTLQSKLDQDQAALAASMFSGGDTNVANILTQMTSNAARQVDVMHSFGADGKPLFTAQQRVSASLGAEEIVSSRIGTAWLNSQEDKIAALEAWRSGEASAVISDETGQAREISLKDLLSPAGYAAAEKEFVTGLKSDLALQSQINTQQDREFTRSSDVLYADFAVVAQTGNLTVSMVEASKGFLEPERFASLSALARQGGASVSDGRIHDDLIIASASGENINDRLLFAFKTNSLTKEDFLSLDARNTVNMRAGIKTPVSIGRDAVSQGLGGLASIVGTVAAFSIGQAQKEYEISIDRFNEKEGRLPDVSETVDIADKIIARYSAFSVDTTLLAFPLAISVSYAEKLSPSFGSQQYDEKITSFTQETLKKYNGNIDALKDDPEFLSEIRLLKKYSTLHKVKESRNAGTAR